MRLNLDLKLIQTLLFGISLLTVTSFAQTEKANVSAGLRVSGEVTGILVEQQALSVASVILLPQLPPGAILNTQINGTGSFEFSNVPPGKYNIQVQFRPFSMKETTTIVVSDHDLTDIKLALIDTSHYPDGTIGASLVVERRMAWLDRGWRRIGFCVFLIERSGNRFDWDNCQATGAAAGWDIAAGTFNC